MNKSGVDSQVISHPTGGGAISGLGESFSPDLHTGTGNLSVPLALPPGRAGLQPELQLTYSTGQGNGPFGLGWSLSVPGVFRDTTKQLPVYDDEKDPFLLSGAEQLVPMGPSSQGATSYRPRTEGLFARITHFNTVPDNYWEVRSRSGLINRFGHAGQLGQDSATVSDPDDNRRIFAWHLTQTVDPFGNRIEYLYQREPSRDNGPHHWDQIYLQTMRYGDYGTAAAPQFMVTVDFFYGTRPDPFSTYKSGFEIRTTQRCTRIEVSTHADATRLSRVYHLIYLDQANPAATPVNGASLLQRIEVEGVDGVNRESLPPVEFGYTSFNPGQRRYQSLAGVSGALPDRSLANPDFELADLFGRGLPDVVQIGDNIRYWRNMGSGLFNVPRPIEQLPSGVRLGNPGVQLADADGDGHIDMVLSAGRMNGYVPLTVSGSQATGRFVQYAAAPPFPLTDPQVRLLDLNGDGITDALRTGDLFELFFHDRKLGWNRAETRKRSDFDLFPDVEFSDQRVKLADMTGDGLQDMVFVSAGSVAYWPYLGNGHWGRRVAMQGRIHFPDGQEFAPVGFDPRRLLLGDVDGDGVADMVYVESGRITVWMNQNGNRWSDPIVISGTPPISKADSVRLVDMMGNGTQGILWTYDLQTFGDSTYKFLDLTGGLKPYLLNERNNHAGARTLIEYTPSTRFYLEDEVLPETRWQTRLPFPVQVVSRVEVIDQISGGKVTTEYRYHQGYWDGDEREFRGFGMVEQLDTETFNQFNAAGLHGSQSFNPVDTTHFSPPTLTRTWFHQGQVQNAAGNWNELDPSGSFWTGDPSAFSQNQRTELAAISQSAAANAEPLQLRHALRALRGSVLRTELYGLDDSAHQDRPYTVVESLFDVREVEPFAHGTEDRLRIFFPFQIASRTTQWERSQEPMSQFAFSSGYDSYGLPRKQISIAVPRDRNPLQTLKLPTEAYLSTFSITEYVQRNDAQSYMVDRVSRSTSFEVPNDGTPSVFDLRDAVFQGVGSLRVLAHTRTFYDGNAFVGLPLGQLGLFGAPVRSETLAFSDSFLTGLYDPNDPLKVSSFPIYLNPNGVASWPAEYPSEFQALLPSLAGYVHYGDNDVPGSPGGYYASSARHRYDFHEPARHARGLTLASQDAMGAEATIEYDAFDLLPVKATDPAGLMVSAQQDYRVFKPSSITDVNGNTSSFNFSPAGYLLSQFTRGKNGEGDATNASLRMEYDLLAFTLRGQPMSARSIRRTHHDSETDVSVDQRSETIVSVEYSDGFGRLLQIRTQAEDTVFGDPVFGGGVLPADQSNSGGNPGQTTQTTSPSSSGGGAGNGSGGPAGGPGGSDGPGGNPDPATATVGRTRLATDPDNVVVSGWQVYDNKGQVVQKYEPFFSQGYDFSAPHDSELGQKQTYFYDPRGHAVRTLNADGSEQLVIFGVPKDVTNPDDYTPTPWEAYTYDASDNAGRTHGNSSGVPASHWNTPTSMVVDALGRTVVFIARNGPDPTKDWFATRSSYDILGNPVAVTDALGRTAFRYTFDLAKRCWRMDSIDAGRHETVLDVLSNHVESRDSKGALTLHSNDLLHRPLRLWARDDASGPVTLRRLYTYGDGGRPDQPAAERNAARALNLLGEPIQHHDEAGLITLAAVDFKGNVLDKSRRMISDAPILAALAQAPAHGWQVTPFQVDWQPAPSKTLKDREAEYLEATSYRTTASYDALNRIKSTQLPQDVLSKSHELRPQYNRAGGLQQLWLDNTLYVERIAYNAKGHRSLIACGNGVMTRYSYDATTFRLNRLRTEPYSKPNDLSYLPGGTVLQDLAYSYDLSGNMLSIRNRAPGSGILNNPEAGSSSDPALAQLLVTANAFNRYFAYDPIYRLLSASGRECDLPLDPPWTDQPRCIDITRTRAYTESYTYDAVGNMLSLQHQNGTAGTTRQFTVEGASNRLAKVQIGQTTYTYGFDANGNMLAETTSRHFEWNHDDQMKIFRTQIDGSEPSVYAHYLYDSAGQRVKKLVRKQGGAVEVTHYVNGMFEHHRWSGSSGKGENNHIHVMDDKHRLALVRFGAANPADMGPQVQFHLADHLGSSSVVVDSTGAPVNLEEFTPYGETSFGSFARKRYRFTGMERDEESGCTYHGARYYSPSLARWLSCDPKPPQNGGTLYSYVSGRPTILFDPTGEEEKNTPTGKATGQSDTILLKDPYDDPTDPSPLRKAFDVFQFGGRSAKAQHRYDSLGAGQSKIKSILARGHGCAACHITTAVHNKYGNAGLNPENNLPWDWTIDAEGYSNWVAASVIARALVSIGTDTAKFSLELNAGRASAGSSKQPARAAMRDVTSVPSSTTSRPSQLWVERTLPKEGRLWVREGSTNGNEIALLVSETKRDGRQVTILTGTHGEKKWGRIGLSAEYDPSSRTWAGNAGGFLHEDISAIARNGHAKNVRVLDVTRMSERELQTVLSEGGDVYAAWCHGDSTRSLQRAYDKVKPQMSLVRIH